MPEIFSFRAFQGIGGPRAAIVQNQHREEDVDENPQHCLLYTSFLTYGNGFFRQEYFFLILGGGYVRFRRFIHVSGCDNNAYRS